MALSRTFSLLDIEKHSLPDPNSNSSGLNRAFSDKAWPILRANLLIADPVKDYYIQHPYLAPLASSSVSLQPLADLLLQQQQSPPAEATADITLALLELNTLSLNQYLAYLWKSRFSTKTPVVKVNMLLAQPDISQNITFSSEGQKAVVHLLEVVRAVRATDLLEGAGNHGGAVDLGPSSAEARQARVRRVGFAERVEELCLVVGVPKVLGWPRGDIMGLRKFLVGRGGGTGRGEEVNGLKVQVEELRGVNRWQGRVITELMYLRLMEGLMETPEEPQEQDQRSRKGERWRAFWSEAVAAAEASGGAPAVDSRRNAHPLATAIQQCRTSPTSNRMESRGADLYSSISTNVNASRIEYKPAVDQWDSSHLALLQALTPKMFLENGEVDWANERKRFLQTAASDEVQPESSQTAENVVTRVSLGIRERPPSYTA